MTTIFLALGSNLGNRAANLALALRMLSPAVRVLGVSRLYQSAPADGSPQPPYFNAACRAQTDLPPLDLLAHVKRIEHDIGRRPAGHWAPRIIDIDIALYEDALMATEALTLPHPRLGQRPFVVRPLLDLEPALVIPGTDDRLADLPAASAGIEVLADAGWAASRP